MTIKLTNKQDSPQKPKLAENLEEIEEQVRNLEKAVNHPPSVENSRKREARTYGMSLTGDRGEVWNVSIYQVSSHSSGIIM